MKQAIMTTPGNIEFRDVEAPGKLAPNEILLKIQRIGVCGSDIHVFHGEHPATPYPVVQGHEYSATIAAVGDAVTICKSRTTSHCQAAVGLWKMRPVFAWAIQCLPGIESAGISGSGSCTGIFCGT
ncbi:MAG: alcohol dehydrogenase catalytic domain-containing protein [Marinilabiliales bacterium]|nr:alcohol dehydrogenase catalytic domain-containing protein [Marinilabiliales bacterium]